MVHGLQESYKLLWALETAQEFLKKGDVAAAKQLMNYYDLNLDELVPNRNYHMARSRFLEKISGGSPEVWKALRLSVIEEALVWHMPL